MTSREEFRKYRSAAHKQKINIRGGTYSDVPFTGTCFGLDRGQENNTAELNQKVRTRTSRGTVQLLNYTVILRYVFKAYDRLVV